MDGIDAKLNGEYRRTNHLPTPSPGPEDVASSHSTSEAHKDAAKSTVEDISIDSKTVSSTAVSPTEAWTPTTSEDSIPVASENARPRRQIRRPGDGRRKSSVTEHEKLLRLSPQQIQELTSEPASIPFRVATPLAEHVPAEVEERPAPEQPKGLGLGVLEPAIEFDGPRENGKKKDGARLQSPVKMEKEMPALRNMSNEMRAERPSFGARATSTPTIMRRKPSGRVDQLPEAEIARKSARQVDERDAVNGSARKPAPRPREHERPREHVSVPLPPMSLATLLSLELSPDSPSPLYIHRPPSTEFPYESSKIKYERLVNFIRIPRQLEAILGFGTLACLDAWLHVLTILPLRFSLAVTILVRWWGSVLLKEARDLWSFVYSGLGRLWARRKGQPQSQPATPLPTPHEEFPPPTAQRPVSGSASATTPVLSTKPGPTGFAPMIASTRERRFRQRYRHRRTKSTPSALLPSHKADLLKGLLVAVSCAILMRSDASRMYHGIRGQSAIKLYVIYNVLEVCDRLLSAIGQDVLECLFSRETLDRDTHGRSRVLRPFLMFLIALVYNVVHATALFYQVITLNVAVNSYSNALLTLLLSNQFVEIKSTVFKRFEKENLFQITCADIVERFQLWLMLIIIGMRNIVEVGGLSVQSNSASSNFFTASNTMTAWSLASFNPFRLTLPKWTRQVLNPFLMVLGSEALVDWLKHAYITKFNQYKPEVYDKFFDVLAKDYYSHAFIDPNLTRRLGLPVLPLACLFIRAAIQTYHMFMAIHLPPPLPSTATSLTATASTSSPTTTHALLRIDKILRGAISRSTFGGGSPIAPSFSWSWWSNWITWTSDDFIAFSTMVGVFLGLYLVLLVIKLLLGMFLLPIARNRYAGMQERMKMDTATGGKALGGWGTVDVDEEKRKWIYNDDAKALERLQQRDEKGKRMEERERSEGVGYGHVGRYSMVAKRIW